MFKKILTASLILAIGVIFAYFQFALAQVPTASIENSTTFVAPINLTLVATVSVETPTTFVARDHFMNEDDWYAQGQKDSRRRIVYGSVFPEFANYFLDKVENGAKNTQVKVYNLSNGKDSLVPLPISSSVQEITLGQLYAVLNGDTQLAPTNTHPELADPLANIMAIGDDQVGVPDRPLLYGNELGEVFAYVRDKNSKLWLIEAAWSFAGFHWTLFAEPADKPIQVDKNSRLIVGAVS